MKPTLLLHCESPAVLKALQAYLENDFFVETTESVSEPQALLADHLASSFIKTFHKNHPQAAVYLLLSPHVKVPTFPFPVRVLETPLRLKTLRDQLLIPPAASTLTLNEFTLYLTNRRLIHSDSSKNVILTDKATDLVQYLYEQHPMPVTREELLEKVWNYKSNVTTHTLETHLYKLKQKLGLSSGKNLLVSSEEGFSLLLE